MTESNLALVTRCMDILCDNVGVVDAERFIYIMRSESFDYTIWQREYYDGISPEELNAQLDKFSAQNPFNGTKAKII